MSFQNSRNFIYGTTEGLLSPPHDKLQDKSSRHHEDNAFGNIRSLSFIFLRVRMAFFQKWYIVSHRVKTNLVGVETLPPSVLYHPK